MSYERRHGLNNKSSQETGSDEALLQQTLFQIRNIMYIAGSKKPVVQTEDKKVVCRSSAPAFLAA
jgi:hypothetical protein